MKRAKRHLYLLGALFVLFAAPGVLAYFFYNNAQYLSGISTNKGTLLNPPILVSELKQNSAKWDLVLWNPEKCSSRCRQKLDELARVRLALGRYLYEINVVLLTPTPLDLMPERFKNILREEDIQYIRAEPPFIKEDARLYIANPQGFLVLSYEVDVNLKDMYQDIKRLVAKNR